jgi:hypothetical protein
VILAASVDFLVLYLPLDYEANSGLDIDLRDASELVS